MAVILRRVRVRGWRPRAGASAWCHLVGVWAIGLVAARAALAALPAPEAPQFLKSYSTGAGAGMFMPSGIAFTPAGGFVVVERGYQHAIVLDAEGDFVRVVGDGFGSAPGQFGNPTTVAVTAAGDILIVDTGYPRIQRFSADGSLLQVFGDSGPGQLQHPTGIAVAPSGDLYVVDQWSHRVVRYSASGAFVLAWGSLGDGPGQFDNPGQVAVDKRGHVYVTDTLNDRIQKFSPGGTFLREWGSTGTGPGQFSFPVGIAVDELGSVFVAETGARRLQRFSDQGVWRATFSGPGAGPGQLKVPTQLACRAPGILLVADEENDAVLRFAPIVIPPVNEGIGVLTDSWEFAAVTPAIYPMGVAAAENGEAFMVETSLRVFHLGPGGQILHEWSARQPDVVGWGLAGIAFHDGRVYISDNSNNNRGVQLDRILVFTPDGSLVSTIGGYGNLLGSLNDPSQVRIDAGGVVHVLSLAHSASRVDRFNAQGTFLSRLTLSTAGIEVEPGGGIWSFSGTLLRRYQPDGTLTRSFAVGPIGNGLGYGAVQFTQGRGVYVLDSAQRAIVRYSEDGTFKGSMFLPQLANGLTPEPWDLDGTPRGDLFVCDLGQRVVRKFSTPAIPLSLVDRPGDEGGVLTLRFLRSSADVPGAPLHAIGYQILRKLDGEPPPNPHPVPGYPDWEMVTTVSGTGAAEYTVEVPTVSDATPAARMLSTYMVRTLTTPFFLIDSAPIVGMSIDDLAPPAPSGLVGELVPQGVALSWRRSPDPEATYRVYGGDHAAFDLHEGSLLAAQSDTSLTASVANGAFYAVTAVDLAGNESAPSRLGPDGTLDAPSGPVAGRVALSPPYPNPARGDQLVFEIELPGGERADMEVFDLGGRRVASREVGSLGAGRHRVELKPARKLAPGLYLVRLDSVTGSQVRRVVVSH